MKRTIIILIFSTIATICYCQQIVPFHYRWNSAELDSTYLSNAAALQQIGSSEIDSIHINAYSSPEGDPHYNLQLSQKRAANLVNYLNHAPITLHAAGENWEGLRQIASKNHNQKLLSIINNSSVDNIERQKQIERLDTYRNTILPEYYNQLRSSVATIFPRKPPSLQVVALQQNSLEISIETPQYSPKQRQYIHPFAIKTNLLYDLLTVLNIELEILLSKSFSILGGINFPWWGGLKHSDNFTLQMLSAEIEARYWFSHEVLSGWFTGVYGGAGKYDFQLWGKGIQGDFFVAAGISSGYAHSIGRDFRLEYSFGVGYLQSDYHSYTPMYYHKIWQSNSRHKWFGPTKAKISLVWMPQLRTNR